jgi:TonB family protein
VNEALDRLIAERQRLDQGLPVTVLVSLAAHLGVAGLAVAVPMLLPREPPLRVADGFAVVLPRGGGGSPTEAAPPAAAPAPQPAPPAASGRTPSTATKTPATTPGGVPGGRGASSTTPGLEFGPPGPGVPDGTDTGGDWYLAGVQQKIWMLWNQQIKAGFTQPVGVTFTILPDGNVTGVRVTQPSGASLLDMAAQRAVLNAAPFGPLPKEYGQHPRTIQALFKPSQ